MEVFILEGNHDYEPSDILGVFSTWEKALEAKAQAVQNESYHVYTITKHKIDPNDCTDSNEDFDEDC